MFRFSFFLIMKTVVLHHTVSLYTSLYTVVVDQQTPYIPVFFFTTDCLSINYVIYYVYDTRSFQTLYKYRNVFKKKSNAIFYIILIIIFVKRKCTTVILSGCLTLINYIFNVRNCPTKIVIYFDYIHQTRTYYSFYCKTIVKQKR